jgi:hypothetical protein
VARGRWDEFYGCRFIFVNSCRKIVENFVVVTESRNEKAASVGGMKGK